MALSNQYCTTIESFSNYLQPGLKMLDMLNINFIAVIEWSATKIKILQLAY